MLGYDFDVSDSKRLRNSQHAVYHTIAPDDQELLRGENEIFSIFTGICLLSAAKHLRRGMDPAEAEAQDERVHSAEQDLLTYLRFRENRVERLLSAFLHNLRRALTHYNGKTPGSIAQTRAISLLAIYKSQKPRQLSGLPRSSLFSSAGSNTSTGSHPQPLMSYVLCLIGCSSQHRNITQQ
jgi:hypothetical protein